MITKQFTITADVGLHARPATQLVQQASRYSSEVELKYKEKKVNVKSIMGVMSLGLANGAEFELIVDGPDEEEAIKGLENLLNKEGIAK
ncbi:MAG TPA: phosphocarrier protein HPr [Candidatus Pseudogracilibacillus intestinigallinarum]|uniref:Phosphocarrier protein HPr n=1 Tax=Candidatus Pseudogracilibacillus intestinigallinarum TaxID=2838742 RepID=A0A9D1PN06_9BACI|nr:phosphocarrier protein HPr [Candidatus Pseudogracilibacillus intestinigallinarum]